MSTKKVYFTSDLHLFHKNIIKYSNRPFRDLDEMHETLIKRYNSTVTNNSVCYFLGDIGMSAPHNIKSIIDQLNGTKVLILGNHDRGYTSMYNFGFDVVIDKAEIQIAKHRVTMSHCPLRDVWREDTSTMKGHTGNEPWHGYDRELNRRFSWDDEGQFHLHGHVHSPNNGKSEKILGKQRDVGVDGNNYTPVSSSEIESWIMKYGRI